MDLRMEAVATTTNKGVTSRRMPSHQSMAVAKDAGECLDIKMNDLADRLAKKGTRLPMQQDKPKNAWSIFIAGGEAPTPTKKWIPLMRMKIRVAGTNCDLPLVGHCIRYVGSESVCLG